VDDISDEELARIQLDQYLTVKDEAG